MKPTDVVPYLTAIRGNAWIAGQQLPSDNRTPTATDLLDIAKPPAILAADIPVGDNDTKNASFNPTIQKTLTAHAAAGGIVSLSMHPPNPWSSDQSIGSAWINQAALKPDITKLLAGTSTARDRYLRWINRVIAYIQTLPTDTPVIFRPWHESGGIWFWWGRDQRDPAHSEAAVIGLWNDTINQVRAACPNIIPAWSGAMSWYSPILYGLPQAAEIVGASLYLSDPRSVVFAHSGDYDALVGANKPVLLFEFGPAADASKTPPNWDALILARALRLNYPQLVGVIPWCDNNSWLKMANSPQVFADARCITRDRLPTTPTPQPTRVGSVWMPRNPGMPVYTTPAPDANVEVPLWRFGA